MKTISTWLAAVALSTALLTGCQSMFGSSANHSSDDSKGGSAGSTQAGSGGSEQAGSGSGGAGQAGSGSGGAGQAGSSSGGAGQAGSDAGVDAGQAGADAGADSGVDAGPTDAGQDDAGCILTDSGSACATYKTCPGQPIKLIYAEAGVPCGPNDKHTCDGHGGCIQCDKKSDCDSVLKACQLHKCVSILCTNQKKDQDETAVDCGGSCKPCGIEDGKVCNPDGGAEKCISKRCHFQSSLFLCADSLCDDGIQDGWETGKDCGGLCHPCH